MRPNKLIIIALISITVVIFIAIIIFITRGKPDNLPQTWTSQQTKEYSVSYPKDWSIAQDPIVGNSGTVTTIAPPGEVPGSTYISIQSKSTSERSLSQVQKILNDLGYYGNTQVIVDGIPATKSIHTSVISQGVNLREVAVVLEKNNIVHLIKLVYFADEPDSALEQTFTTFLSQLKFD